MGRTRLLGVALDPKRTVSELRELRELTGDENGAQRVAWTDTWERSREWLRGLVAETGARQSIDQAGNQWFTLGGESDRAVLIGGHMDSVPNGGWLDGSLNVVAGVEVLRRIAAEGTPPVTVRLVSWADEEGARFGRSLFGSSAAAGSMSDQDELRDLSDSNGTTLPDALAANGVDLDSALLVVDAPVVLRGIEAEAGEVALHRSSSQVSGMTAASSPKRRYSSSDASRLASRWGARRKP